MKIALGFSLKLKLLTSLRYVRAILQMTEKNQRFLKALSKDTQGTFHYRVKFLLCALLGQTPNPKKAKAKAKMALASLVSSQKQKRTIVKIFLKSDTKKRFSGK